MRCADDGGSASSGAAGASGAASPAAGEGATSSPRAAPNTASNRLPRQALIVACDVLRLAPDPEQCVGVDEFVQCSVSHCALDACVATCKNELNCAFESEDHCKAVAICPRSEACLSCMSDVQVCTFVRECSGLVTCATPAQSGACSRLQTCCATQREPDACLDLVEALGALRGDAECETLLRDQKFLETYASDPPCRFD